MDAFVRQLVLRLLDEARPLTRNRHFATLETPEGKLAVRVARRLKGVRLALLEARRAGGRSQAQVKRDEAGVVRVEISLRHLGARRLTVLDEDEYALLTGMPGVADALGPG